MPCMGNCLLLGRERLYNSVVYGYADKSWAMSCRRRILVSFIEYARPHLNSFCGFFRACYGACGSVRYKQGILCVRKTCNGISAHIAYFGGNFNFTCLDKSQNRTRNCNSFNTFSYDIRRKYTVYQNATGFLKFIFRSFPRIFFRRRGQTRRLQ